MSEFQKGWLALWSWGVVLFGAILAAFAFEATDGPTRALFALFGQPIIDPVGHHLRFAVGLMGCVTVGWGLTFKTLFDAAHQLTGVAARRIWRGATVATLIWYGIDSLTSIATGFWMNAVSNTILLILYLIPVMRSGVLR